MKKAADFLFTEPVEFDGKHYKKISAKNLEEIPQETFCGLEPYVTGPNDPYYQSGVCPDHDKDGTEAIEGVKRERDSLQAAFHLAKGATKTLAIKTGQFLWALGEYPFILLIGGIGGILRTAQKMKRPKGDDVDSQKDII